MIQVEHLTKRYGPKTAIDDVTFTVEKGEVLAFLGPNGAGKTTTMRILAGSLPATSGTARVAGHDCFDQPMEVKRVIGYLPEIPPLYTEMTVTEYLTFASRIKAVPALQIANAVDQVMQRLGLGEVRGRLIANLSRGFKQRVGLAQALVHNPPVLILDEPTAGLDPKQIIEIRELIRELAGSHTIILSTHILPEATAVARRVVIIHEGRIVAQDSQERLSARLRRSEKVSLMLKAAPPEARDQLAMLPGVLSVQQDDANAFLIEAELGRDLRDDLARFVVARQWGLLELKLVTITLEDVFLRLTQEEPDGESVPRSPSQEGGSEPAEEVQV
jgi:ABC-2 type transport system ATP-binding protein